MYETRDEENIAIGDSVSLDGRILGWWIELSTILHKFHSAWRRSQLKIYWLRHCRHEIVWKDHNKQQSWKLSIEGLHIAWALSGHYEISRSPIDSSIGGGFEKFMWGSEDDQLCGDDNSGYRGLTWHILDKCYKEVELCTFFISH